MAKSSPGPGEYKIKRDLLAACTKLGQDTRDSFFLKD